MKRRLVIALVLLPAAGWYARQHAEHQALNAGIERLTAECRQAVADTEQAEAELARTEASLAARAANLASLLESNGARRAEAAGRSRAAGKEIPSADARYWNEACGFAWLRKEHLTRLGAEAFTFVTPGLREISPAEQFILNEASPIVMKLNERFPEFRLAGRVMAIPTAPAWDNRLAALELTPDERRKAAASQALSARWLDREVQAGYIMSSAAATLLAMNDNERGAVQAALQSLLERQHQLERDRVQAGVPPPPKAAGLAGNVQTFLVPAFPEEGCALREGFEGALRAALGEQRADYFLQLARPRLKADLGEFGQASRTITFGDDGAHHTIIETGSTGHFRHTGSSVGRLDLPASWQHLIEYSGPAGAPILRP